MTGGGREARMTRRADSARRGLPRRNDTPGRSEAMDGWFRSRWAASSSRSRPRSSPSSSAALVILAAGHNPLAAYKAIFDGTGLNPFS